MNYSFNKDELLLGFDSYNYNTKDCSFFFLYLSTFFSLSFFLLYIYFYLKTTLIIFILKQFSSLFLYTIPLYINRLLFVIAHIKIGLSMNKPESIFLIIKFCIANYICSVDFSASSTMCKQSMFSCQCRCSSSKGRISIAQLHTKTRFI